MKTLAATLIVALFVSAGCGSAPAGKDAIRQGVMDHLSGRAGLDVSSMDVEVTNVEFRGDEAEATVAFQAKGSTDPAAGMQMKYTLERKGNRWVVKSRAGAGAHGGAMEDPHGETPPPAGTELPPGHPPTGGSEQAP